MAPYFNNMDPFLIKFSSNFGIRWYGLAYILGFVLCFYIVYKFSAKKRTWVPQDRVADFIAYLAFGTMIGGRLGYCLFYDPSLLTSYFWTKFAGFEIPVWEVLAVWKGGMASHGGILGMLVACLLFGRIHKINSLHLMDLTCLAGPIAVFFGRIANFINGELYGRACEGKCIWPVLFPNELRRWVSNWDEYKPQLKSLHSVVERVGTISSTKGNIIEPGKTLWEQWIDDRVVGAQFKIEMFVGRILGMAKNGNEEIINALKSVLIELHPSQLYQAFLEGLLVFLIVLIVWKKPQKPGVIVGVWGLAYSFTRIIGEQFRMPDAHIGYELFGLTRGQWLSFALIVVFGGILLWSMRRASEKIGGWGN